MLRINCPESKSCQGDVLFCHPQQSKPKDIQFTIIEEKEKNNHAFKPRYFTYISCHLISCCNSIYNIF